MNRKPHLQRAFAGYNLALKFGIMITLPVFCSLFAGIFLDKTLNTAPWLMLIFMPIGFVFSIYAVYRVSSQINKPRPKKEVTEL